MSREDAVDYYFDFDKDGAIQALADEQDRGDTLAMVMMVLKRNKNTMGKIIISFNKDNNTFRKDYTLSLY